MESTISETNTCGSASLVKSGVIYHITPSIAPSSVSPRISKTVSRTYGAVAVTYTTCDIVPITLYIIKIWTSAE